MKMIDLRLPKMKDLAVGDGVITTKGFTFIKTDTGFRDVESGLEWSNPEPNWRGNYNEAIERFANKLPTKEEYKIAEEHGFREVLEISSGWFWSSSVNPNYDAYAYDFNGYNGDVYFDGRSDVNVAALCVSGR